MYFRPMLCIKGLNYQIVEMYLSLQFAAEEVIWGSLLWFRDKSYANKDVYIKMIASRKDNIFATAFSPFVSAPVSLNTHFNENIGWELWE